MADTNARVRVIFEAVLDRLRNGVNNAVVNIRRLTEASEETNHQFDGMSDGLDKANSAAEKLASLIKTIVLAKIGQSMINFGTEMAQEYGKTQTALGEIASLGYEDLETLRKAAIEFSNTWSGTTREQFISAAYDIKSGIAGLTDEGVSKFTEMSGLTAKATKSTVEEMTDLFATGYGIYKNNFISAEAFAEQFSAGISKSVQQFKTNGSEMASFLSSLGASAQQAGAEVAEIFSIGGTLQATMSGSEAATQYSGFLTNAVEAGKKLGLAFTDANNRLLPAVDIIDLIRQKYGNILDAIESTKLKEAFGDETAIAFISSLYQKTNEVRAAQIEVNASMNKGIEATKAMASTMNTGILEKVEQIKQQWSNVKDIIGQHMEPGISSGLDIISDKLINLQSNADFSVLGNAIGNLVSAISEDLIDAFSGTDGIIQKIASSFDWLANNLDFVKARIADLLDLFVAMKLAMAIAPAVHIVIKAYDGLRTATNALAAAQALYNAAMEANPIGFIATVITAVILVLIKVIKYIVKINGGIEGCKVKFLNAVDTVKIKWNQFCIFFLKSVRDLVQNIPLIGEELCSSLDQSIANSEAKILKYQERINQRNQSLEENDDEANDEALKEQISDIEKKYQQKISLYESRLQLAEENNDEEALALNKEALAEVLNQQISDLEALEAQATEAQKEIIEIEKNSIKSRINQLTADATNEVESEVSAAQSEDETEDQIKEIEEKYAYKEALYESRADLAKKQNDTASYKSNKQLVIDTLKAQAQELLKLGKNATGTAKDKIETARNKLLSKIADITSEIKESVSSLVGSFNAPSELSQISHYDYITSNSKTTNSKYMNQNNIEVLLKVNDLGTKSLNELNQKLTQIAELVGTSFGGKDQSVFYYLNDASRN